MYTFTPSNKQQQFVVVTCNVYSVTLTVLDKLLALFSAHAFLKVSIAVPVQVSAARASNGEGLTNIHPTKGNAVDLATREVAKADETAYTLRCVQSYTVHCTHTVNINTHK